MAMNSGVFPFQHSISRAVVVDTSQFGQFWKYWKKGYKLEIPFSLAMNGGFLLLQYSIIFYATVKL